MLDVSTRTAVNQVWATDITYIPLQKGFLCLVAILDLFSRHMVSWKFFNSLKTAFCLECFENDTLWRPRARDLSLRSGLSVYVCWHRRKAVKRGDKDQLAWPKGLL